MNEREIELEVCNLNGLTFMIRKDFNVPDAAAIQIEVYNAQNQLVCTDNIVRGEGGFATYNQTKNLDRPMPTLRNWRKIKNRIILRHNLPVGHRVPCRFSIMPDNTHLFKIYI